MNPTQLLAERVRGHFRGYSGRGVALATLHHLVKTLKKDQSYTFTRSLGLHGLFYGGFKFCTFTFAFILGLK
jgi:hypothetical protein